ncbi:MAG: hypothetical protein HQL23_07495 [Candidatus Omnitrophica bacterium]|nr:hypothetical protein [Candidatus Omnitrophota bacterium]
MKSNYLKLMLAVTTGFLLTSVSARAAEPMDTHKISGEITWIDTKLGKLQLQRDQSPVTGAITEYRVTEHETRVKAPVDKKFLSIKDLQPGQHVTLEIVNGQEDKIVPLIKADPIPVSEYQEAYGEIAAIDVTAGTLTLSERPNDAEMGDQHLAYFIFDPQDIIVRRSPNPQPVRLEVNHGDVVRIEYVVKDEKRRAHSLTLYSPQVTSTTTTTTTTITR